MFLPYFDDLYFPIKICFNAMINLTFNFSLLCEAYVYSTKLGMNIEVLDWQFHQFSIQPSLISWWKVFYVILGSSSSGSSDKSFVTLDEVVVAGFCMAG